MSTNNKKDLKYAGIWLESHNYFWIIPSLFIYLIDYTCKIY